MLESSVNTNFISEKVAKIRFCPEEYSEARGFVTGSYDMTVILSVLKISMKLLS